MAKETAALVEGKEMLSVRDAANIMNVSYQTIKNYIYSDKIRTIKTPGGQYRIYHSDMLKIMANETASLENREMFSVREVASILHVSYQTIKNYIYAGKIKTIKTPGGQYRIPRSDLMNLGFIQDSGGGLSA